MKNLFRYHRSKIYAGIILGAVFAMAVVLFSNIRSTIFRNASALDDYSVTFNRDNGGTGFSSSYSSLDQTNSSGHTKKGNSIPFVYRNVKSTSNKYCTIANGGYLYNTRVGDSGLTGIESVQVTFTGSLSLYSSKTTTFSGEAKTLSSGSALTISANYDYFKIVAGSESVIDSITVYYTCAARSEDIDVTDVIVPGDLTADGTTYQEFSNLEKSSGAIYAGKTNYQNSGIGMRTTGSDTGIVVTKSGGIVKSINVTWTSTADRYLNIYAKNTAYEAASDLFDSGSSGTNVGNIHYDDTTYTFDSDYSYFGIRSSNSALSFSRIEIVWSTSSSGGGGEGGGEGGGGDVTPTQATYQHVFNAKPSTGNNVTLSGVAWNITASNLQNYNGNYYAGVQFGTSKASGEISLTSSSSWGEDSSNDYSGLTIISEIRLWLNKGGGNVTPSVSIGGVDAISDGTTVVKNSSAGSDWSQATKVTFTPASNGDSGVVVIDVESTAAGYICCIEIDCESAAAQGPVSVSGVSLNQTAASITNETGVSLTATISPSNATNQNVTWSTSNGNIATVDQSGNVTGITAGNATITVTTEDGGFTATCTITVTAVVHVTSVSLNTNALALHPGDQSELTATVLPANASNKNVTWSTSNASYATVNNGSVTAVAAGTATITVTTVDGNKTATCTVTVTNVAVTGISLNKNSLTLDRPGSETLTATITPSNASNKNVNWSSENTNVATVSGGTVTAVGTGTTTIYAKSAENASIQATCTVTVNPVNVTSVSLNKNALSLTVGGSETLTATVSPSNADNTNVNWSTSDSSVATVSSGTVSAVAAGTATITATSAADSSKKATCTVTVTSQSPVSSYTIEFKTGSGDGTNMSTSTGNSSYIESGSEYVNSISSVNKAYYAGSNGIKLGTSSAAGSLTLSIDSTEVSTIVVNAKLYNSGKAATLNVNSAGTQSVDSSFTDYTYTIDGTITSITLESSKYIWISAVTVNIKNSTPTNPTGISIDPSSLELGKGGSRNLIVNYTPANANQNKEVTWERYSGSSNISVDQNGLVTVSSNASVGNSAAIRATLTNLTSIYAQCTVTVTDVQKAKYTVLLYLCGSTLEYGKNSYGNYQLWGAATDDMTEILEADGTYKDDVNIVVETGGSKKWETTYGVSNSKLEVRHVENGSYVKDNQNVITSQGNMGSSSTLQTFLEYGLENYPADKTAVILWDHGAGIGGVCVDDNNSSDCLTTSEVATAVRNAKQNTGVSTKLEWIGYDACLMGVADVASINADYFNYMVASQELEPGNGWDYKSWVSTLYNNPTSTSAILNSITTSYKNQYNNVSGCTDSTLAAYDLSYMSAFTTAFNSFADQLTTSDWNNLKSAYTSSMRFGDDDDDIYLYGLADMKIFMTKVATKITRLSTYTSAVINALTNLVIYNKYCSYYSSSTGYPCGISVFFAGDTTQGGYPPQVSKTDYTTSDTKFTSWRSLNISNGKFYDS